MENTKYELWVNVFLKDLTDILSSAKEGNLTVGRPTGSTGIRTRKTVYRYLVVSLGDGKTKKIEDEQVINEHNQFGKKKFLHQHNLPNYKRLLADINDLKEKKRIAKDKGLSKVNLNRRAIEIALLLVKKEGFDSWFIDNDNENEIATSYSDFSKDEITKEKLRSKKQDRLKHSLDYSTEKDLRVFDILEPNYTVVKHRGKRYEFTLLQGRVIKTMYDLIRKGRPAFPQSEVLDQLYRYDPSHRPKYLRRLFVSKKWTKGIHPAWGKLIKMISRNNYTLDLM